MNEAIRMQLSAFVDGELPDNEKELLLRRLSQDAGLRQQVAEYMAIGRAMRGETLIGGANAIRDRIADSLGDKLSQDEQLDTESTNDRWLRPLSGVAIAATVALVGILGLRQVTDVDDPVTIPADAVVESGTFPTQPDADELLRQYGLMHDAFASRFGANNFDARRTSLELLQENAEETDAPEETGDDESPQDDASSSDTTPSGPDAE